MRRQKYLVFRKKSRHQEEEDSKTQHGPSCGLNANQEYFSRGEDTEDLLENIRGKAIRWKVET